MNHHMALLEVLLVVLQVVLLVVLPEVLLVVQMELNCHIKREIFGILRLATSRNSKILVFMWYFGALGPIQRYFSVT